MRDFYKILRVAFDADEVAIKKAYRKLSLAYHPDVNKAPDAAAVFMKINEAYETLIDPGSRMSYNIALRAFYASYTKPETHYIPTKKKGVGASLASGVGTTLLGGVASVFPLVAYWLSFCLIRGLFAAISCNFPTAHYGVDPNKAVKPFWEQERKASTSVFVTADGASTPVGTPDNSFGSRFSPTGAITRPGGSGVQDR